MQKKQRIRYELAHARRKYGPGASRNSALSRIGRSYDLSTGGGPLRGLAMGYTNAKYW